MTASAWQLAQPERDVLAEALAHPSHEVTAGDPGWGLVRRGLLTLTFGGEPEDIAAHVRAFKLTEAGVLCAQGRLDFVRDRFGLWRPILDGREILDLSRCHQKQVCETLGSYIRGWMRQELAALDEAFGHETVGPFPQEPGPNWHYKALREAAEGSISHHLDILRSADWDWKHKAGAWSDVCRQTELRTRYAKAEFL